MSPPGKGRVRWTTTPSISDQPNYWCYSRRDSFGGHYLCYLDRLAEEEASVGSSMNESRLATRRQHQAHDE